MFSGLWFQKLENFKKAEEFYLYTFEKRPEDPKILNALFKLNKRCIKNKKKALEYGQKQIKIYQNINLCLVKMLIFEKSWMRQQDIVKF
ncbi:unnamed protein product [Paramecium primaurelia]|uniref:Uncharacterized protein n=1 Tax=Paramecium primaurelia TaxID=5886 RepID=A0A8S1MEK9_PARPR|nr:unnamed protein product [Paramecium primaurelia]